MRVGLMGHALIKWGGGIDLLRTIAASLASVDPDCRLYLLAPTSGPKVSARRALGKVIRAARLLAQREAPHPQRVGLSHLLELQEAMGESLVIREIDIGSAATYRAARYFALDALLPTLNPLPRDFPTPWVGYIYDFQHRYFPDWFSARERRSRDRQFAKQLAQARSVIVNAKSVAADIDRFFPDKSAQVFALPFSAAPQDDWLDISPGLSASARGISSRYFIVCNQFWKHKDHKTAFSAFALLAKDYGDIDLVCTGSTNDYRDQEYFPQLLHWLKKHGLEHRVHIVGMVAKAEQIALLRGAIALVQPTLFEGGPGGGAVFDAVALNIPCLVSDIDVNRELVEPGVNFFRAGDPADLERVMRIALLQPRHPAIDSNVLRERGLARRRRCGEVLLHAIDAAR